MNPHDNPLLETGGLTRFANSTVHQHVQTDTTHVSVRVAMGQRIGATTTNGPSRWPAGAGPSSCSRRRSPRSWSGTSMTRRKKHCLQWCAPHFSPAGMPPTEAPRRKNPQSPARREINRNSVKKPSP